MSTWRVIVATIVIFSAGLFAGGVGGWALRSMQSTAPAAQNLPPRSLPPNLPFFLRQDMVERMRVELDLTAEQFARIEGIVREGQERTREIWALVGPELRDEFRRTGEQIRGQLTPDQVRRFEQLPRLRNRRPDGPMSESRPGRRLPMDSESPSPSKRP